MIVQKRNISPEDFLEALQNEYICTEIRSKIYIHENNRAYFLKLLEKKRESILLVASKIRNAINIVEDKEEYKRVHDKIVPEFGLPKFIYQFTNVKEKDLMFFFKGTVVYSEINKVRGITNKTDIKNNIINIRLYDGNDINIPASECVRLSPQETDEYYYYYPNSKFLCDLGVDWEEGFLQNYNIEKKEAEIIFDGTVMLTLKANRIKRVL